VNYLTHPDRFLELVSCGFTGIWDQLDRSIWKLVGLGAIRKSEEEGDVAISVVWVG
jgi:hypothetical protein